MDMSEKCLASCMCVCLDVCNDRDANDQNLVFERKERVQLVSHIQ
jgi:hypothetical protein